jgi:hypothetical protein
MPDDLADAFTPTPAHFAAPLCRNCGAALQSAFCGRCGQQRVQRLNLLAVGAEAWQNYRWFEFGVLKAAWRLLRGPGVVAREYVLGARRRHLHPLKLLLIAIGVLVLILARTSMLDSADAEVGKAMAIVRSYANWSFSIGILAIVTASMAVLSWRQPYNLTEHLVLGAYCHAVVIAANAINLLPTLAFRDPQWLALHRTWSGWPMDAIEALIVAVAFKQFFALDWRRHALRLLAAAALFAVAKGLLLRLYAIALVKLVLPRLV